MSDRSQATQQGTNGPQAYAHDSIYWIDAKPDHMWRARIKGLFPAEVLEWIREMPPKPKALRFLIQRAHMNDIEAESWAEALTEANKKTFESFVDREQSKKVLTLIVEAEADTENPRAERIGYVNKRKQEL